MELPKIYPDDVFDYPEYFLGLFCVVVGVPKGGVDPANALLPFGFGLIAFCLVRRNFGNVYFGRDSEGKRVHSFKELFGAVFWLVVAWLCFHWWALDVHLTEPWVRRFLYC